LGGGGGLGETRASLVYQEEKEGGGGYIGLGGAKGRITSAPWFRRKPKTRRHGGHKKNI